jgi:hypothetical protein
MTTVAHHQPAATLVALGTELPDVGVDLGLQRLSQHPPGTLTHDVIDHRRGLAQLDAPGADLLCCGLGDYGKHGSYLPDRRWSAGLA